MGSAWPSGERPPGRGQMRMMKNSMRPLRTAGRSHGGGLRQGIRRVETHAPPVGSDCGGHSRVGAQPCYLRMRKGCWDLIFDRTRESQDEEEDEELRPARISTVRSLRTATVENAEVPADGLKSSIVATARRAF
jgi:hypothetical protein